MTKITRITKSAAVILAVMTGTGVSLLFMRDLLHLDIGGNTGALSVYASLISDMAASVMAGIMAGWLVHFCLWECLAAWLCKLWMRVTNKSQLNGRAQGVEQIG